MADIKGVIFGFILEWWKRSSAREDKRREKYEQFMSILYENDHWLKTLYRIRIEQSGESEQPPPYKKQKE
jgi:hypothetical protein